MKLRSTLLFAAASLSASALLPVAATTSAFFAATSVPAMAGQLGSGAAEWNDEFTSADYESVENLDAAKALLSGTPNYFVGDRDGAVVTGSNGSLQIGQATKPSDGNVYGVVITDAHSGTQTFNCGITGTGVFAVYRAASAGTTFDFTGDVSGFSGDFFVKLFDSRSHTLKFSGTGTSALSGTGSITTNKTLSYAVASGTATIANSSISAATLNFSGGTTYTVNSDVTVTGTMSVDAGTTVNVASGKALTLSGGAQMSVAGTVSVNYSDLAFGIGSTLTLGAGSVLDFGASYPNTGDFSLVGNVLGTGTVKVASGGHKVFLMDSQFRGTLDVTGNYNPYVNALNSAATLKLSSSSASSPNSMWGCGTLNATVNFATNYAIGTDYACDYTFNGVVAAADGTTVTIANAAGGTVSFNGSSTTFDALVVSGGGTVNFAGAETSLSTATVSAGTVNFSGGALTAAGNNETALFTVSGGTLTIGDDVLFNLTGTGALSSFKLYTTTGSGTVNVSTALDRSDFTWNGKALSSRAEITVNGGDITFSGTDTLSLVWNGTAENNVWNQDVETNTIWTVGESGGSNYFAEGDSATFDFTAESKTVSVSGEIIVDSMTVSDAYTFNAAGDASLTANSLNVSANAAMTWSGAGTLFVDSANLTLGENASLTLADGSTLDFGTINGGTLAKTIISTADSRGTVKVITTAGGHGTVVNLGANFNGTLDFTGKFNPNGMTLGEDAVVALSRGSAGGSMWGSGTFNNDTLFKTDYQIGDSTPTSVTLNGDISAVSGTTLSVISGSTVVFGGNVALGALAVENGTTTFSGSETVLGSLTLSNGSVTFKTGGLTAGTTNIDFTSANGSVTFSALDGASADAPTSYSVGAISFLNTDGFGRTVTVEENVSVSATSVANNWGFGTLTVNGALDVSGEFLLASGGSGSDANKITGTGTLSVGTLAIGNWGTYNIDVDRLEIGAGGIRYQAFNIRPVVNLGAVTIAATETWTNTFGTENTLTLGDKLTFEAAEGVSATLDAVLADSSDSAPGSLEKTGAGTLTLSGTNTFTGGITVSEGTLVVNNASALGTGATTVNSGATLGVASALTVAGTLTLNSGAQVAMGEGATITVASSGTVSIDSNAVFALDDMVTSGSGNYTIFTVDGGQVSGWDSLTTSKNFTLGGTALSELSYRVGNVNKTNYGITMTVNTGLDLTWAGTDGNGAWNISDKNWTAGGTTAAQFFNGDNVTFSSSAANKSVEISDALVVGSMAVSDNYTFTTSGEGSLTANSLSIAQGSTMTWNGTGTLTLNVTTPAGLSGIAGTLNLGAGTTFTTGRLQSASTYDFSKITGSGAIVFNMGAGNNPGNGNNYGGRLKVSLSDEFSGEFVMEREIWLSFGKDEETSVPHSTFGNATIVLSGNALFHSVQSVTLDNNIRFDGEGQIWADSGNAVVDLTGDISGTGTFNRRGNGTMNLSGNVDVATFNAYTGTTNFTGTVDVATVNAHGGTTNFTNTATSVKLGTVNVKGGTVNFAGTATADSIALDNANSSVTVSGNVSTTQYYGTATINHGANTSTISDTGVLNITGTVTDGSADPNGTNAAFALTHWGSTHTFNVAGVLNVADAGISNVDGAGVLNINSGGEANFGAGLWVDSRKGTVTFNVNGGTLNIGANAAGVGINTAYTGRWAGDYPTDFALNLNGGTIGSLAESWSSASALRLGGAITFDTTLKEINADGNAKEVADSTGSTIELSGVISGDGLLTKTGAGTLMLSGANTYTGGTTVSAGTLVAGGANALGTGATTVDGTGTLKVTAENGLGAGAVTINSGTLLADVSGSLGTGDITLAGGTLTVDDASVNAVVSGKFTATGGTVALEAGSLTLTGTVDVDTDAVTFSSTGGKLEFSSSVSIVLDNLTEGKDGVYTFTTAAGVLGDSWANLDVGNIYSETESLRGKNATFNKTAGTITLIGMGTGPITLYWKGGDGNWTTGKGNGKNTWEERKDDGARVEEDFLPFDNVVFESGANVAVQGNGVVAGTVTISGGNVSFSGGKVTANGGFTVAEGGTLTLTPGAGLKGDITVEGKGTLDVNGVAGLSDDDERIGTVTLAGGALVNNGGAIAAGTSQLDTVVLTANSTVGGEGDFGLVGVGNAATSLDLAGNTLTKTDENRFYLVNTTTTAGTIAVEEGTLEMRANAGGALNIASDVTLAEGATSIIRVNGANSSLTISGNVTVSNLWGTDDGGGANTMTVAEGGVLNITGTITSGARDPDPSRHEENTNAAFVLTHWNGQVDFNVEGVLNVANAGVSNVDGKTSTLTVSGEANFGKGLWVDSRTGNVTFNINGGTLNVGANDDGVGINTAYTGRWNDGDYPTDFALNLNGGTIGSLAETWSSSGALTLTGANTIDTTLKEIYAGGKATEVAGSAGSRVTLSGVLSGEGSLTKTGAGTLTLYGTNTYTGETTVEEGTLHVIFNGDNEQTGGYFVDGGAALKFSSANSATEISLGDTDITFRGNANGIATLEVGANSTIKTSAGTNFIFENTAGDDTLLHFRSERGGKLVFTTDKALGGIVFESTRGYNSTIEIGTGATLTLGSLTFTGAASGGETLGGAGTLVVNDGIALLDRQGSHEVSVRTLRFDTADAEVSVAAGTLTISSESLAFAEGVTNGELTKTGAGTLALGPDTLQDFSGSLTLAEGAISTTGTATFDGAGTSFTMATGTSFSGNLFVTDGAELATDEGARIVGNVELDGAKANFATTTLDGNLTISGTELTFGGTVSGIQTLTWGADNKITKLTKEFRATISSAGRGVLLDFNVGRDGAGNPLTEDFDFDATALAGSFRGREAELVYNAAGTSLDVVVTGALNWNDSVTYWRQGNSTIGGESPKWDLVTKAGVVEETKAFASGNFVQFLTAGSTVIVGDVDGKRVNPKDETLSVLVGDGSVSTSGIVFNIADGGAFTLQSQKWYNDNANGVLEDFGQSSLNSTDDGDEGITVLAGAITIEKNVVNNLKGGVRIYGGSLRVSSADSLGTQAGSTIELGAAGSGSIAQLIFANAVDADADDRGEITVYRQIQIGNENARIGVTGADVTLFNVIRNAEARTAVLTKTGSGTLNIVRGTADDKQLDSVAVSEGELVFKGDDGGLLSKNVSVSAGATFNVEHGGSEVVFDSLAVNGSVIIGIAEEAEEDEADEPAAPVVEPDHSFAAGVISVASGASGSISGHLNLGYSSHEVTAADGTTTTVAGTLFDTANEGTLTLTGKITPPDEGSDAKIYKTGAGTLTLAAAAEDDVTGQFALDADLSVDAGTVRFSNGVNATGTLKVTGSAEIRIDYLRAGEGVSHAASSFANGVSVDPDASVTFTLGRYTYGNNTLSFEKSFEVGDGGNVSFTSIGGTEAQGRNVRIEDIDEVKFGAITTNAVGELTGGRLSIGGEGTNIVNLSVAPTTSFSAGLIQIYGASSLTLDLSADGATATAEAISVDANNNRAALLDLGGGTLALANDKGYAVLSGDGTLRISNGTLNVKGQNYSAEATPGIVLDNATFNFDVDAGTGTDVDGAVVYTSLREISTAEDSTGTVSKTGAGTLVLYEDTTGVITFDGEISLKKGATHLYATLFDMNTGVGADLSVDAGATLNLYAAASTDGEIIVSDDDGTHFVRRLSNTLSGAGTLDVANQLYVSGENGGILSGFNGTLSATNGGKILADAGLGDWQRNGGTREIVLNAGGVLESMGASAVALTAVSVAGRTTATTTATGTLRGSADAPLSVDTISGGQGSTVVLSGYGTAKNIAFNTAGSLSVTNGEWSVGNVASAASVVVEADDAPAKLTLTGTIGGAMVLLNGGTLDIAADGDYDNAIYATQGENFVTAVEHDVALVDMISVGGGGDSATLTLGARDGGKLLLGENVLSATQDRNGASLVFAPEADSTVSVEVASSDAKLADSVTISGAGTFEKAGDGTLTIGAGSEHSVGTISVAAGTLTIGADAKLSAADETGTLSAAAGATLNVQNASLSAFTLSGAGTANLADETSLGAIKDAAGVSLKSGTVTVAGNVSDSVLTFADGTRLELLAAAESATVSRTTFSGGTVTLVNGSDLGVNGIITVDGSSSFDTGVSTLVLNASAGRTRGVVDAEFSGSLEKTGDGTWTVSNYTCATDMELNVRAGTLEWRNAKFADGKITLGGTNTQGTLRIRTSESALDGKIGGTGTLEIAETLAEGGLAFNVSAADADADNWNLKVSGTSVVTVNSALPGSVEVADSAKATLALAGDMSMGEGEQLVVATGATLVKDGAGTLTVANTSASRGSRVSGTVQVAAGTLKQAAAMSWNGTATLDVASGASYVVDLSGADGYNYAKLTGAGTFSVAKTDASGYDLGGNVAGFEGTVSVANGATLTVSGGTMFDAAADVAVADGGTLIFTHTAGGTLRDNVSGAGTVVVDVVRRTGFQTAQYRYDADTAKFTGAVEVLSGVLSVSTADFEKLGKASSVSVGGGGSLDAGYDADYERGIMQGGFLRLENAGGNAAALEGYAFGGYIKDNGGVLFAGDFSSANGFGGGVKQLYVTENGSTLTLADGADVNGSLFVRSGSNLVLSGVPGSGAATASAGTATFLDDAGTTPTSAEGNAVSGNFTLNGRMTCNVSDATNTSTPLLEVGGNAAIDTAGNNTAEIVLDVSGLTGSLEGLTLLHSAGLTNVAAGTLNARLTVTDSTGRTWTVTEQNGTVYLGSAAEDSAIASNMRDFYRVLENTAYYQNRLSSLMGDELNAALVALSPVSFGSLVDMQSGFAALENDLLRERLEQRRYERTFAGSKGLNFRAFVNVLGSDGESDGDGTKASNYDVSHAGALGGFDVAVSDNTLVGLSLGLDWTTADLADDAGKHEGEGSRLGVYGMSMFGNAYVGYGLSAGGMSFETKRSFRGETMRGDTDGNDVNATLLVGAGWVLDEGLGLDVAPYVGLDLGYAHVKSFTETGSADTALDVDSIDRWSLRGKIGATLNWRATERLRVGLEATFAHEFLDSDVDIDAALGGNAFSTQSYLKDENTISVGPRVDFRIDDMWSLSAAYTFETDLDETTTHSANLGLRARF